MMKKGMVWAIGCSLLLGCSEPEPVSEQPSSEAPVVEEQTETQPEPKPVEEAQPVEMPKVDVWQAPVELDLGEVTVKLQSDLWLNSMPQIGDDGSQPAIKLQASIKLQTTDMKPLPDDISVSQVLVQYQDQQWLAQENIEVRAEGELSREIVLQAGPEWPAQSEVDVAVTLSYQGEEHTLIQQGAVIEQVF